MAHYSALMRIMTDVCQKASRSLRRDFYEVEQLQVSRKGVLDFVTKADKHTEKQLIDLLLKARPQFGILSEEAGEIKGSDGEYRWIIDPLDGTINFMHSIPFFCISLALEQTLPSGSKDIVAAVVYAPFFQEFYWAEKHKGAWIDSPEGRRRLQVAKREKLNETLISTGCAITSDKKTELLSQLVGKVSAVRALGATALELAFVATGKIDAYIGLDKEQLWDIAAGLLLVQEAGGESITTRGETSLSAVLSSNSFIVGNTRLNHGLRESIFLA